jgi:hypothetical protein
MKQILVGLVVLLSAVGSAQAGAVTLFDGKTFAGWDGDTNHTWRVAEGAIVAGDLQTQIPRNEFAATTRQFTNFVLRLKFKLEGTEGFVNGGVQIRSQRVPNDSEMSGYQADIGDGWYGCVYDESRRNKVLAKPDPAAVAKAIKVGDWNTYVIRCVGPRTTLTINGVPMADYTETDATIPLYGRIGLQVHGGGKTRVSYRDLTLEELP